MALELVTSVTTKVLATLTLKAKKRRLETRAQSLVINARNHDRVKESLPEGFGEGAAHDSSLVVPGGL